MGPSLCRSCLAFLLKLLNFLHAFVGVSVLLYSLWLLSRWTRHGLAAGFYFDLDNLPAPWFICASMGIGVLMCLIALTGHVAAEAISGCCLCFYSVLTTMVILLESALVSDVIFNKNWEKDLPNDSTGELKRLREFIENNLDVCKWAAIAVIAIQALSLLLSMVMRAMIPSRRMDYDSDEDYFVIRRPLINPQGGTTFTSIPVENKGFHTDIWSSRMREKYGLNQSQ